MRGDHEGRARASMREDREGRGGAVVRGDSEVRATQPWALRGGHEGRS